MEAKKHQYLVSSTKFYLDEHYKPTKSIGSGAYGVVCAAWDNRYNKKVAIKKITNAFDDTVDAKRILREIKLLAHFRHDNVVSLLDMVPADAGTEKTFHDVYMFSGSWRRICTRSSTQKTR